MKKIGGITEGFITNTFNYREPFADPTLLDQTTHVVHELFKILPGIFPAFRQAYPTETEFNAAKREWVKGFLQHHINNFEMLNQGLSKLRALNTPFIPSIGQFIALCQPSPEDLGLPSMEKAYKNAVSNAHPSSHHKNWACDEVKEAVKRIGSYNFSHMTEKEAKKAFESVYKEIISEKSGTFAIQELPNPENTEEEKKGEILPRYSMVDSSERALSEIYKMLEVKPKNKDVICTNTLEK